MVYDANEFLHYVVKSAQNVKILFRELLVNQYFGHGNYKRRHIQQQQSF